MLKIQLKDCERKNDAGRSIFGPAAGEAGRIPKHAHKSCTHCLQIKSPKHSQNSQPYQTIR